MKFLIFATTVVVLLVVDGVTSDAPTQGYPEQLAKFLYMINGDFVGTEKTADQDGNPVVNPCNISYIPVTAPGFTGPAILVQWTKPDMAVYFLITLTEDVNTFLHAHIYKVRKADVQKITKSGDGVLHLPFVAEISGLGDCEGTFEVKEDNSVVGSWKYCLEVEGADEPILQINHENCDSITNVLDLEWNTVVYKFVRYGERYPQPAAIQNKMSSTEDPCQSP